LKSSQFSSNLHPIGVADSAHYLTPIWKCIPDDNRLPTEDAEHALFGEKRFPSEVRYIDRILLLLHEMEVKQSHVRFEPFVDVSYFARKNGLWSRSLRHSHDTSTTQYQRRTTSLNARRVLIGLITYVTDNQSRVNVEVEWSLDINKPP
jgi:hypothetical protein